MKTARYALLVLGVAVSAAQAQSAQGPSVWLDLAQQAPAKPGAIAPVVASAQQGPMTLMLRGLDKITGRPTEITAPIGRPVRFATLTITVRSCYSTPASETPETSAFVQIEDRRPDQPVRRVFSGWLYASSPGLNAVDHPLYDVWVISCKGGVVPPSATAAPAPAKVKAPDSSDREKPVELPAGASR
jgi:hypothetical protein